ncbi:DciA family protein [Streptomyces sp. NPDC058426]|uniref:DciA family protein n=1 Tax=Streptomyces sp. NPDC058426 TaxID=3346493 RepID=UPI00365E18AA
MSPARTPASGADLARVALRAALEEARKNGAGRPAPRTPGPSRTASRRGGREPVGLGAALQALLAERAWELPAAGATLRERWAVIAPDLAENVAAVGYDANTGRLTLSPRTPLWATETRLRQAQIIEAANASAGRTVVHTVRVLTPGTGPTPAPAASAGGGPTAPAPVQARENASPGYHQALGAHQQAAPAERVDHGVLEADRRADEALQPAARREDVDAQRRTGAEIEAAARRRARADRAARAASATARGVVSEALDR